MTTTIINYCFLPETMGTLSSSYSRTDPRWESGWAYSGVEAELSGAPCLLHADKEPLSHYSDDSGCIPEENMTVSPTQTVSPGSESSCEGQRG